MDRDSLALLVAQGLSAERIGQRFGRHPSTVSYWMRKYGLGAPNRHKHAARGGIDEAQLRALVDAGRTMAQIAVETGVSRTTARHWLRRYGLRTHNRVGPRLGDAATVAKEAGRHELWTSCLHHGETAYVLEGRGYYRCRRCRSDQIARHRRGLKGLLVAEAGGSCRLCGYDTCLAALHFHHVDPSQKSLGISAVGLSLSLTAVRTEISKCVPLCSNCHAEVEAGVRVLPLQ
ncbi:MAG: helix-turn-helix domain-containing protein [Solirubrobacterales bacterium]|nr:helix-turn-helix domain-containing protein [Solirubrobacterales bacterium]